MERSYIKSVQDDLRTLCKIGTLFEYAAQWDIQRWVGYITEHYKTLNRQIRLVFSSTEATRHIFASRTRPTSPQSNEIHPCGQCNIFFNSRQQLQLHMYRKHGSLHPAHLLVNDTHCSICLTR